MSQAIWNNTDAPFGRDDNCFGIVAARLEASVARMKTRLICRDECDAALTQAVEELRADGIDIDVAHPVHAGHAVELARVAAGECDRIIAGGGDGTVHEIVNGLIDAVNRPALGIVPLGTANDFARAAGIPEDPVEALKFAATAETTDIDVVQMNDRFFINVANGGGGAAVSSSMESELKRRFGRFAYLFSSARHGDEIEPFEVLITGPDFEWDGEVLAFIVGGGGISVAPLARLNDGLIDVMVIPTMTAGDIPALLSDLLSWKDESPNDLLFYRQLQDVRVECSVDVPLQLDGEHNEGSEFQFTVMPAALRCVLPADSPRLK